MSDKQSGIEKAVLENLLHDTLSDTVEIYIQVLRLFIDGSAKYLEQMCEADQNQDAARLAHVAHTLKSNGLSLGAHRFSDICHQIEMAARAQDLQNTHQWYLQLKEEFEVCCKIIEKELALAMQKTA